MIPGSKDQPVAGPEKKSKKNLFNMIIIIAILLIAVMVIGIIVVTLQGGHKDQANVLTVVNETQVISTHLPTGTVTSSKVLLLDQFAGKSLNNTQLNMVEQYYNSNNGTLNLTKIVVNTPGFDVVSVTPSLPAAVPNAPSMDAGNLSVRITCDYPSLPYSGPFNFTVYFDYYPETG